MRLRCSGSIAAIVAIASGIAWADKPAWAAGLPLGRPAPAGGSLLLRAADSGIDIVRMPPRLQGGGQSSSSTLGGQSQQAQPKAQARLIKLPIKVGSQPSDSQKGWLGVRLEPLETALSASLGLDNANGALVLEALANGPLSQSGIRFGDVIVALNGKAVEGTSDLFRRVVLMAPDGGGTLDVWRGGTDEADFLQTLRRLAYGGNAQVMGLLGKLYATGSGVVRDDTEALQWYRRGADAGNVVAMTALGAMALEGRGAPKDTQE